MNLTAKRVLVIVALGIATIISPPPPVHAHESPVDHVDREMAAWVSGGRLYIRYRARLTERMAIMELDAADTDRDGSVSDAELDAYLTKRHKQIASQLRMEADGKMIAWTLEGKVKLDPGLGQTFLFSAPVNGFTSTTRLRLVDRYSRQYPGGFRYLANAELPEGAARVTAEAGETSDPRKGEHPEEITLIFRLPDATR